MTTAIAAIATTAAPIATIASPSIASDGRRPLGAAELALESLWLRRRELTQQIHAAAAIWHAIDDAPGCTREAAEKAVTDYEDTTRPILETIWLIEAEIERLPASINKAGALLLLSLNELASGAEETPDDLNHEAEMAIRALEALAPALAGAVAEDAADVLSHRDRAICEAIYYA
ncbi:hypothetical protein DNX69_07605 [Rhodopseudomonas palustris]|uniref:Uncharacterized protein n=1 Tax=Rhodopseudomonas palustris TaxID=1076 RepID=A0A323UKL5_RHOPL|nr:hypothetical protein [Rhodopseudomonas palustris]PZA12747.1 hypothetical protein DNX69_07605 [Rhodopseudomonas palustris]